MIIVAAGGGNIRDGFLVTALMVVLWGLFTFMTVALAASPNTKKARKKLENEYPFFRYRWYKKIFFLGTKGYMPFATVILSYVINISILLLIIASILSILDKAWIFNVHRVTALIFAMSLAARGFIVLYVARKRL